MFKNSIARLILTTSPVELLIGGGIRCRDTDGTTSSAATINLCRHFHHISRPTNSNIYLLSLSTTKHCSTAPGSKLASSVSEQLQQQLTVNVTKCGVAKNFHGSQNDVIQEKEHPKERTVYGDDACFIANFEDIYVAGIADGVGGWRNHGIDPSEFSSKLMANCAEIVHSGKFELTRSDRIIEQAYNRLKTPPRPVGSSTACVVAVNQRKLYAANLGDSGYLIWRNGKIIFRSQEQTHYFNAPYQLTLLPERIENSRRSAGYLLDGPESIDLQEHELEKGDLILIASDGLWDNVPEETIGSLLAGVESNESSLQARCNSLVMIARHLSNDAYSDSPFTKRAKLHGIRAPGGKPDDVTIVLFYVS